MKEVNQVVDIFKVHRFELKKTVRNWTNVALGECISLVEKRLSKKPNYKKDLENFEAQISWMKVKLFELYLLALISALLLKKTTGFNENKMRKVSNSRRVLKEWSEAFVLHVDYTNDKSFSENFKDQLEYNSRLIFSQIFICEEKMDKEAILQDATPFIFKEYKEKNIVKLVKFLFSGDAAVYKEFLFK